ncbi:putative bifunctional diguanylate cyclase/phosphodiesterase [Lysobacter claricitrinus]|uniref:putative bifunctional diguanylate cyclase/phosphodiesterase n=1 Tax=Lysobacter claricitrinus TaxID=3367728 RepID=UPI0037DA87DF
MSQPSDAVPRTRAARLRRHTVALVRAAAEILRSGDSTQWAFATLAPAALDALGLARVSLWERTDGDRLECKSVWPPASTHVGLGRREATPSAAERMAAYEQLSGDVPGWAGELAQLGTLALLDVPVVVGGASWGRIVFESATTRPWHADERATARHFADVLGVAIERERRREAEARLEYLQMYDDTSGVANRALFLGTLHQRLRRMHDSGDCRGAALLFIDVDRFHSVNEFFGEAGGNRALATLAVRLNANTPEDATIGRLESDVFGVLLPRPGPEWHVTTRADALLQAIAEPIVQDGRSWEASASIGIAFARAVPSFSVEEWVRDADMASKAAKQAGRNRVEIYDPDQHQSLMQRLAIERGLREALREDRIEVAYQAEYDLETGEVVGAEALARWRHPDGRLIAAGEFIEVAESTGLIEPIGHHVLQHACRAAAQWPRRPDGSTRTVRVNLSARQFAGDGLRREVERALADGGLDPGSLCLEITETTVMAKAEEALDHLRQLKALGVCLAIDDFGTGYSSLSYLKRFPVDALKLDKTMVDDVESDETVRVILQAIQTLAGSLGLDVVVEGVESEIQKSTLQRMGIRRVQGFLLARPESGVEFMQRIAA